MIVPTAAEAAARRRSRPAGRHRVPPGHRGGAARMYRQHGAHQGSDRALVGEAARRQAVDQIPQLMRGIIAGLLMLGKTRVVEIMEGIDRALRQLRAQRRHDVAAGSGRSARRRHRRGRVLHGNAAGRPHRPLVHARQRRELPALPRRNAAGAARRAFGGTTAITRAPWSSSRCRRPSRSRTEHEPTAVLDPVRRCAPSAKPAAVAAASPPAARAPKPRRSRDRSGIPRAVHRGSEGRDHQAQAVVPAVGRESAGSRKRWSTCAAPSTR